ncbi:MAG: TolC family protein [Chitinophagaceae bacterium]
MKCSIIFFIFLISNAIAFGQSKKITLQEAIETAINNNILVRQRALQVEAAEVNYKQSKTNLFPSLNANVNHGINKGRSIDPFTNAYVNQKINYANYGVGSGVVLFNGFGLRNNIRRNAYAYDATKMELQLEKENLTLDVILAYLQVLSNEDLVELSKRHVEVSQKQILRLEILNREGAITPNLLYDLRAQQKTDEVSLVDNKNAVESSKLFLFQLMNVPYNPAAELERVSVEELLSKYAATADEIYNKAIEQLSAVKAAQLRTKSSEAALKAARSELFPTLSLNGGLNSNYSSLARREILVNTTDIASTNYVVVNGVQVPVMVKQQNFNSEKIGYNNQLKKNVFSNIGVALSIPIFNSFQVRNRIKLAAIGVKDNELVEENTRLQLRQEIDQAYLNMSNAWERYKVLLEQVNAYAESFRAAEVRFNAGVGNSVDYLIAKNNLDRANINLVAAKYDYILRTKILDFYRNGGR